MMINKVFCNELKQLVSGEEVWELNYGKQRINRELTFKCLDPECTARFIVRNCLAHFAAWETTFRLYPRSKHRQGCSYLEFQLGKKKVAIKHEAYFRVRPSLF